MAISKPTAASDKRYCSRRRCGVCPIAARCSSSTKSYTLVGRAQRHCAHAAQAQPHPAHDATQGRRTTHTRAARQASRRPVRATPSHRALKKRTSPPRQLQRPRGGSRSALLGGGCGLCMCRAVSPRSSQRRRRLLIGAAPRRVPDISLYRPAPPVEPSQQQLSSFLRGRRRGLCRRYVKTRPGNTILHHGCANPPCCCRPVAAVRGFCRKQPSCLFHGQCAALPIQSLRLLWPGLYQLLRARPAHQRPSGQLVCGQSHHAAYAQGPSRPIRSRPRTCEARFGHRRVWALFAYSRVAAAGGRAGPSGRESCATGSRPPASRRR